MLDKKIASIDIGSNSIKLILSSQRFNKIEIVSLSSEPVDLEGNIGENMFSALERLIKKNNLENYDVFLNLPVEYSINRFLNLPFNDYEKISEVISFELENNLPIKIEEAIYDFSLTNVFEENNYLIRSCISEKNKIDRYLQTLKKFGISPVFLGTESDALLESIINLELDQENFIHIDIGFSKCIINIVFKNEIIFTRTLSKGIKNIIFEISKIAKVDKNEAFKLLNNLQIDLSSKNENYEKEMYKSLKLTKNKFTKILNYVFNFFEKINDDISLTIKTVLNRNSFFNYSQIVISGGGSNIIGLKENVIEYHNIAVIKPDFLPQFTDPLINSFFHICFGTILSASKNKEYMINLLPKNENVASSNIDIKKYGFVAVVTCIVIIVFLIHFLILNFIKSNIAKKENIAIRNYFKQQYRIPIKDTEDPIVKAQTLLDENKRKVKSYETILSFNKTTLEKLDGIISGFELDDSFILSEFTLNEKSIEISGQTNDSSKLDKFSNNLKDSNQYESVVLDSKLSPDNSLKFVLKIKIK